jgi:hypothetical protein
MDRNGEGFRYLQQTFLRDSGARMKEGIFVDPQVKELVNYRNSDEVPEGTAKTSWEACRLVVDNFVDNHKAPNYRYLVEQMLEAYRMMGCKCR